MCMKKENCQCPLCGSPVIADGDTAANELLIRGIVAMYREMQQREEHHTNPLPCPRCGHSRMSPNVLRNALSRHEDIYVCDLCGTDEAMLVARDDVIPTASWWVVRELLG